MQVDEDDIQVDFMTKTRGSLYMWPDTKDTSYQPVQDIVATVQPPVLENCRGQFRFHQDDIDKIKDLHPRAAIYFK